MPSSKVELAHVGAGPAEQLKALVRLQGRSFICAIHDECGNRLDSTFVDMAAATLRGPAHPWLQERYGIPADYPEPARASCGWMSTLPLSSSCQVFGIRRSLRDVRPGAALHRPWLVCVCPIPRCAEREHLAAGC